MKTIRKLLFGYFDELPEVTSSKPMFIPIMANGKLRFVRSSVGTQQLDINKWFKYIHSKAVQKLYANKFKS